MMGAENIVEKTRISWFPNKQLRSQSSITIGKLCELVRDEKSSFLPKIKHARKALSSGDKETYDQIKGQLPAVTISGIFPGARKAKEIKSYTQLIILDIDKLSGEGADIEEIKRTVIQMPITCVCFKSPSNDGLKIIVKVSGQLRHHKGAMRALMDFYRKALNIPVDVSGKDVPRLCYLSHDPDIFTNFDSHIFSLNMDVAGRIASARRIIDKRLKLPGCGRNNYVFELACVTNKYGLKADEVEEYCIKNFEEHDFPASEVSSIIASAYTNKEDHNTWVHLSPDVATGPDLLDTGTVEDARAKLKITDLVEHPDVVLALLLQDINERESPNLLVQSFSQSCRGLGQYFRKRNEELVFRRILEIPNGKIDDVIGERSPSGKFCLMVDSSLRDLRTKAINATGKRVILEEYSMLLARRAFEEELALAADVAEPELDLHVSLLRTLEDKYNALRESIRLTYELSVITDEE